MTVWSPEEVLRGAAFVAVASTTAHVLFSRLGFNPTDDGFILAGSRRIRDGQVPHRDFVSIRPALSHVLHVPTLVLGRDRAFLLGRFIYWIQIAVMAWTWSALFPTASPVASATTAFVLSSALFPPMPWHTVDALFLATLGMGLASSPWGMLLGGMAPLCRQNFVLLLPVFAFVNGTPWSLLLCVPVLLYVAWIGLAGGLRDLGEQLSVYQGGSLLRVGVLGFLNVWTVLGVATAILAREHPFLAPAVAVVPVACILLMILTGEAGRMAYLLFGMALMFTIGAGEQIPLLAAAMAWVSSLSIGYPYPAMASGGLFLIAAGRTTPGGLALTLVAIVSSLAFLVQRRRHVYRQPSAKSLVFDLSVVLRGARGIRTNAATREVLADLEAIKGRLRSQGLQWAIVPDLPGVWACDLEPNPLSCDWPQETELGSEPLRLRIQRDLKESPSLRVLVQKFEARGLADGVVPLPRRYSVVDYVRRTFVPLEETRFFTVYGVEANCKPIAARSSRDAVAQEAGGTN